MDHKYLTVTALTKYIKRKIDSDPHLGEVYIKGEISNFNHHRRGHMYFTLKDDQARISAVMFAGYNRHLKFVPENGMSVFIKGEVSVYENFGQYQLYVHQMIPDGVGSLYLAFEQLKRKLEKEGLFDEKYKKPLPKYPKNIGIITSDTGAAIQDILSSFKKRYPIARLILLPTIVQGELAADSIISSLEQANQLTPSLDMIILGRGGGSLEDLQPFNEEKVARAIFSSKIPVISAVGHETDVTISDFVADLRAPTPTGAVMLSVPSKDELLHKINHFRKSLYTSTLHAIQKEEHKLNQLKKSHAFRYPEQLMKQKEQELDFILDHLDQRIKNLIEHKKQKQNNLQIRLLAKNPKVKIKLALEKNASVIAQMKSSFEEYINQHKQDLVNTIEKLSLLSPLHTLKRGFALPYNEDHEIIISRKQVEKGEQISIEIKDGFLDCQVKNVREKDYAEEKS